MRPTLPVDVMELIVRELKDRADIFRLMLVGSAWRSIAERQLYTSVELVVGIDDLGNGIYEAQTQCFRKISSSRIAPIVRRLDFVLCPELEDITDRPFDYPSKPFAALLKAISEAFSRVINLEILGLRGLMHEELWILDNASLANLSIFIGPDCAAFRVERSCALNMLVVSSCRGCDQFKDTCAVFRKFSTNHASSLVILAFEWDENDVNRVLRQVAKTFPSLFELEIFGATEGDALRGDLSWLHLYNFSQLEIISFRDARFQPVLQESLDTLRESCPSLRNVCTENREWRYSAEWQCWTSKNLFDKDKRNASFELVEIEQRWHDLEAISSTTLDVARKMGDGIPTSLLQAASHSIRT